jgi:hypothetical protein
MKEDELYTLRQQDSALRDALRLEEAELPQMPSDLNARVMQRAAQEAGGDIATTRKSKVRKLWPWLAAACVAAFIAVNIAPPKDVASPQDKGQVAAKVEKKAEVANVSNGENGYNGSNGLEPNEPTKPIKPTKPTKIAKPQLQQLAEAETSQAEEVLPPVVEEPRKELAQATATTKKQPRTLTEHDIPITRPENYKYTPEELAQLRKQADEAYLKWVELELEISKNNLQQTAQQE